jgi:hypothetical protein
MVVVVHQMEICHRVVVRQVVLCQEVELHSKVSALKFRKLQAELATATGRARK